MYIWSSIKVCGGGQGLCCMVSPVCVAQFFQQTINPNSNSLFSKSPKSQGTPPQVYAYATTFLVVQNYPPVSSAGYSHLWSIDQRFHLVQQISKVLELWKIQRNQLSSVQLNQRWVQWHCRLLFVNYPWWWMPFCAKADKSILVFFY